MIIMTFILRAIAWPIKACAWLLIVIAFLITCKADDSLGTWIDREFL